jgi:Ion channel
LADRDPTSRVRRQRYGVLLGAIIVVFAIQGIATPSKWEQVLVSVLLGFVLLLALWETRADRRLMLPAGLLVVGVILASIVATVNGDIASAATRVPDALVVALTPPAIVVGAVRDLRFRRAVTLQTVFAVLSIYILLGMFFANVYGSIDVLGGNPFFAEGQQANVAHCLYYSFTTMTTVGYGDLTARTSLGHTLSVSEGLLGQIYLVTVVALIVTNLGRRRPAVQ